MKGMARTQPEVRRLYVTKQGEAKRDRYRRGVVSAGVVAPHQK
jgi:hypothetical protein